MHREALCVLVLAAGVAGCNRPAGEGESPAEIPNATTVVMQVEGLH